MLEGLWMNSEQHLVNLPETCAFDRFERTAPDEDPALADKRCGRTTDMHPSGAATKPRDASTCVTHWRSAPKAVLRRLMSETEPPSEHPTDAQIILSDCVVDVRRQAVIRGTESTSLTTKQAQVLAYLAANPRRSVSRDELLIEVWGYKRPVVTRAVDTVVQRLRARVERDPKNPEHLYTVFGEGYRFEPPARSSPPPVAAPHNLPPARGAFLGRDQELAQLSTVLEMNRF